MGTPDYATIILDTIIKNNFDVVALFTQPDKPVGRKQILTPPHIKNYAIENNLQFPIYQPTKLRDIENIEIIKALKPDFIVVAAYGQILPKEILDIAPCINLHASLLPLYRGASPIQEALLNSDAYTGVTAMLMDIGLDSGDILGYQYIKIDDSYDVMKLFEDLSQSAANLTISVLDNFSRLQNKKQNLVDVSYCKKIKKTDGEVEFENARSLLSKYKAYKSWPEIYLPSGLKLKDIQLVDTDSSNNKGEILEVAKDYIIVGCIKGKLKIKFVQPQSKQSMNVVDYIRGKRLNIGDYLS
ncbi:methionyl-tRNA formyltransferase [Arcobacter sp. FWKO B]|nr:methionyl-tRNA formyltransferase [Arcobacter sp. FWKO B]